jgi:hypothetical protein
MPQTHEHRLSSKAENKDLGGQAGGRNKPTKTLKKKAPKMIMGDTKSAPPGVKEQIIKLKPMKRQGDQASTSVTVRGRTGGRQTRRFKSRPTGTKSSRRSY